MEPANCSQSHARQYMTQSMTTFKPIPALDIFLVQKTTITTLKISDREQIDSVFIEIYVVQFQ